MPIRKLSSSAAFQNLANEVANRWPNRSDGDNRVEPIARPHFTPSFSLEPGEKVFTIGSCFARNVERHLERMGFEIPMRQVQIGGETHNDADNIESILNNYGVTSILNELRWALDPEVPFDPSKGLLEITPDKFADLHLSGYPRPLPWDKAVERRARIGAAMKTAAECRVVIMTLGLVEVWWDNLAELYLNVAPPKQFARRSPERFELHVLSYEEIVLHLDAIINLLRRFGRPDQRIIISVSPVPLGVTFTTSDVMVANTYSKAVLRAAVEQVCAGYGHIDYFPSYESVVLSDRREAWRDDMIHVSNRLVHTNVSRMVGAYARPATHPDSLQREARIAEAATMWERAADLYRSILEVEPENFPARLGLARSLGADGQKVAALAALEPLDSHPKVRSAALRIKAMIFRLNDDLDGFLSIKPELEAEAGLAAWTELANSCLTFERFEEAKRYCELILREDPFKDTGLRLAGQIAIKEGRWSDAEAILKHALERHPRSPLLYYYLAVALKHLGDTERARENLGYAMELSDRVLDAKHQFQILDNIEEARLAFRHGGDDQLM
jgi:hypothetical protein